MCDYLASGRSQAVLVGFKSSQTLILFDDSWHGYEVPINSLDIAGPKPKLTLADAHRTDPTKASDNRCGPEQADRNDPNFHWPMKPLNAFTFKLPKAMNAKQQNVGIMVTGKRSGYCCK